MPRKPRGGMNVRGSSRAMKRQNWRRSVKRAQDILPGEGYISPDKGIGNDRVVRVKV